MEKPYTKTTIGFVAQIFNENGKCTSQEFIAGDQVDREDEMGEAVDSADLPEETYECLDMVVPEFATPQEIVTQIGKLHERVERRLEELPNFSNGEECNCSDGVIDSYTYHQWDFSSQDMLLKICLKCGGWLEID